VFRPDGRIMVFFSPHSGHQLPPPSHRPSKMRYRMTRYPYSIRAFEPVRHVLTNVRGGLGYTYPNPVQQRGKLWLFWRGGGWNPTFSYTRNGRDWVPARELLTSEAHTRRVNDRDTFYYAYHNGNRWISRKIVDGGPRFPTFTSGGATLDHEDPRIVYLSRRTGDFHQVEAWVTPDNGRSWRTRQLTADPDHYSIRPVTPRGLTGADMFLCSRGDRTTTSFTHYLTRIHAIRGLAPPV
jgi:hypothetical protein